MSDVSRRTFLAGVGATAAAVTAGAVLPEAALAATRDTASRDTAPEGDASTSTLVVHVTNAATGELTVHSGDREVIVTDRRLAQRLARLAD
jgi:hypothetical protein